MRSQRPDRWRRALALVVAALAASPVLLLALLAFGEGFAPPRLLPERLSVRAARAVAAGSGGLFASLLVSAALAACVAAVSTAVGFVTGRYVARHRFKRTLLFLSYLPVLMSPVVLGSSLLYAYLAAGIGSGLLAVFLAHLSIGLGFSTVFFSGTFTEERRAFEDVVATLGGGSRDLFVRVLVPMARDVITLCFFQAFLLSFMQYGLTLLVGAGTVQTLPLKVYLFVSEANPSHAAVAGLLLVAAPALLAWAGARLLREAEPC